MTAIVETPTPSPSKAWTVVITNEKYLTGALTLAFSLRLVESAYPLVVLYTPTVPDYVLQALHARAIPTQKIDHIIPANGPAYTHDPRFLDCWTKLCVFGLTSFSRIVQLDADMLVRQNMDELMTLPLSSPAAALDGSGDKVFAAGHACVCNPLQKTHYPRDWVPANCAFMTQHADGAATAHLVAPRNTASPLGYMNGGLLVVVPSAELWTRIQKFMHENAQRLPFADQSVLSEMFVRRWEPLPYVYNALKTMRWKGVHDGIWQDDKVKNVHYIMTPKPWDEVDENGMCKSEDPTHQWWVDVNLQRKASERLAGIKDDGL
ncbi:hypothetical protein TD95_000691 [Thielaviopsis punctulata]|uniref:Glycosyl transferase family 8 C-terminal domain-containing protein n=1 Tax=Thielaviopsis punctulata TaxID=72032 RepID=A0A0F4ZGL3_9PEZI|nr:hypothetical protein TD95_000691 [Thielaviopsis punctulata]